MPAWSFGLVIGNGKGLFLYSLPEFLDLNTFWEDQF